MADAMATVGTFHALSASEARTAIGAWPSSACDFMIHTPRITPRMTVMAAMMKVTGIVALTVVYVAPVMRLPSCVRWENTPST